MGEIPFSPDNDITYAIKSGKKGELNDLAISATMAGFDPQPVLETEEAFGFEALARPLTTEGAPRRPLIDTWA